MNLRLTTALVSAAVCTLAACGKREPEQQTPTSPVAASAAAPAVAAVPLEFKGVPFGSTFAEVKAAFPGKPPGPVLVDCSDAGKAGTHGNCKLHRATYANIIPQLITLRFLDGKLESVNIQVDPEDFAAVKAAISAKYGKPQAEQASALQNGFGASFNQDEPMWAMPDGGMIYGRKYANASTGYVTISSAVDVANFERRMREKPPPKKDI